MFKDDNTVIHFQRPEVTFQVNENMLSITGQPETKQLKDLLPGILKQCGPQQFGLLKDILESNPEAVSDVGDSPPQFDGQFGQVEDK